MNESPTNAELMSAIVDLHGAMTQGFGRVELRLDAVECRLGNLGDRVGNLETRVTGLAGQIAGLQRWTAEADVKFDHIGMRLTALETRRRKR